MEDLIFPIFLNTIDLFSYEESVFLASIVNKYITKNIKQIKDEFTNIINKKLEDVFYSKREIKDTEIYMNYVFSDYIQSKILDPNLFSKEELEKIYTIWIQRKRILDFRVILRTFGFESKRI